MIGSFSFLPTPLYLALKEVWRNKGRFFLVSLVVALITTLVLFIAGLTVGLGEGNREYIENLNGEIVVYQDGVDLSIPSSRLAYLKYRDVMRVDGVTDAGPVGFGNASIITEGQPEPLKVSFIGVKPGKPGEPPVYEGRGLLRRSADEIIIDRGVVIRTGAKVGDTVIVKTIVGTEEKFYELRVAGITESRQYFLQPSVFVPYITWDRIQTGGANQGESDLIFNIIAAKLENPNELDRVAQRIEARVSNVEAVDRVTAYQATPGYSAQQDTLNTQRYFTLLIGILVLGGFFQIQTLQKVAQVGMLKAIGASSIAIILAAILQIVTINMLGVAIGGAGTLLLSLAFPPTIPIEFTGDAVVTAVVSLLLIGPLGGVVSIRTLLNAEPLTALGLGS